MPGKKALICQQRGTRFISGSNLKDQPIKFFIDKLLQSSSFDKLKMETIHNHFIGGEKEIINMFTAYNLLDPKHLIIKTKFLLVIFLRYYGWRNTSIPSRI